MVYILLGTGFEEIEALTPVDLLRRAGVEVKTVGLNGKIVYGSHAIGVEADMTIEELDVSDAEMLVLPGGLGGVASIRGCGKALEAVKAVWAAGKYVAAICAGPTVLAELGLLTGKRPPAIPDRSPICAMLLWWKTPPVSPMEGSSPELPPVPPFPLLWH